ncbi:hypothetical protein A0U92_05745 [Acetobacter aceti]|uniref:Uncharacterized protein n=1 Tax=Acetobacter aceti TaxID=435 RepID=A0A1U9KF45_ACEAC|nr:hypothetical protein A0U92_05745 [Acetobacter aceti]
MKDREKEADYNKVRSSFNRNFSLGTYDFIYLNPQVAEKGGLILPQQKEKNPENNKSWLFENKIIINRKEINVDVSFSYINDHTLFGYIKSEYGSNVFSDIFINKSPMNVFGRNASSVYWFYPEIKNMIQEYKSNRSRDFFYKIANSGALPQFGDGRIINTQIFKDHENKTIVLFGSSGYIPLVGAGAQFFFARFDGQSLQPMCLLISGIGSWSFNEGKLSFLRAFVGEK